jgi:hypothetical protein
MCGSVGGGGAEGYITKRCHCARDSTSIGRWGGDQCGRLVKDLLKVPFILQQPTQINHRVSVILPDYDFGTDVL